MPGQELAPLAADARLHLLDTLRAMQPERSRSSTTLPALQSM